MTIRGVAGCYLQSFPIIKETKMKTNIILKAKAELEDKQARQMLSSLWTKIETLNERTKSHTLDIKKLEKKIKDLENGK